MELNKNSKKILILGIILLILAGMIVVALKGVNVSLMFGKHETVQIKLNSNMNLDTMKQICDDVFENKKYVVKELEVFGDSVQINVESITDEEKTNLVNQINEKFETEKTVDDFNINTVSNKRIRDVVKPYIAPMIIAFAIVFIYMLIRFRKINAIQIVIDFVLKLILTEAILLSIVAVIRIPVSEILINLAMVIAVTELVITIEKAEKKLETEKIQ